MYFFLVRHGQSLWNAEGRHQGWQNVPLSPLGEQQAERIAQRLKSQTFDYMFTSPIKRCYDTAAAIVQAQGRPLEDLIVRESLKEARLSAELEGLAEKEILKRWTPEQKQLFREDYSFKFPDGESVKEVMARMVEEFQTIAALSEEAFPNPEDETETDNQAATGRDGATQRPKIHQKSVLIVAHQINIQLFILYAMDALDSVVRRQNNIDRLGISNCALSVLEVNLKGKQPHYRLLTINDINHLAGLTPPKPSAEESPK
jgi:broad specificity phosphatase PhoE